MTIVSDALASVDSFLPGLADKLSANSFIDNESEQSQIINWFKLSGGCKLMVKRSYGGRELTPWQGVLVQLGLGIYSPSLAIGAGMHQFSIATLQEMAKTSHGLESLLLEAIAKNDLLVSSAFSEGNTARSILQSQIVAKPSGKGFLITGTKKPCSLAHDMDLLTASVQVEPSDGEPYFAVALIHKENDGVNVESFWNASFLKASQSEAVHLDEVYVPHSMMVNVDEQSAYHAHISGFVWFELLTSASYLGMVYGLVEQADKHKRLSSEDKAAAYIKLDSSALALKAIAYDMNNQTQDTLAQVLACRYQLQEVLAQVMTQIIEKVGGINYIGNAYFSSIAQTIHAFNFHPPAKHSMLTPLASYYDNKPLIMV
ncbi:acyl-CoA/acyl-ACP dehydrogenase [Pseudoalteromonas aurantia]|uniref:Acyl-CoA dehydrogenase n=1 Tax=Pseudoalteromonas aurantia 208 TaxID=1314867 RepID=A0ABR9EJ46_9GAMM|nr:acyl-CoA/acyl-ACP dehydrogenase [Pseudoalteromonas aurantia]MBE0370837.1 hypothetical protein [Pseudoalteromonas aurantia 208]